MCRLGGVGVEVAVSTLRANLSHWLERVRQGDEVVVTERGVPVARLVQVGSSDLLARLEHEGVVAQPSVASRSSARGRKRVRATRSAAAAVSEQR